MEREVLRIGGLLRVVSQLIRETSTPEAMAQYIYDYLQRVYLVYPTEFLQDAILKGCQALEERMRESLKAVVEEAINAAQETQT